MAEVEKGDVAGAKNAIDALIDLLVVRCKKGIFDKDPDFSTNFGLCEGRAIQIDVGRFHKDPSRADPSIYKDDLIRATDPFYHWLRQHYPSLGEYLYEKARAL